MAAPIYTRQRGETITIGWTDDGAASGGEALISCHLRRVWPGRRTVDPSEPVAASLTIAYRAAAANFPVGWTTYLDAATSLGLAVGTYQINLKISDGFGNVFIGDPRFIIIEEPA